MREWICLRCDSSSDGDEPACPRCGAPLYRMRDPAGVRPPEASTRATPQALPASIAPPSARQASTPESAPAAEPEADGVTTPDATPTRRLTVIGVAFVLAAVGMVGSFFQRASPDRAATSGVVGEPVASVESGPHPDDGSTGPPMASPETSAPGACPTTETQGPIMGAAIGDALASTTADYAFQGSLASWIGTDGPPGSADDAILVETGDREPRFAFEPVTERSYRTVLRFARGSGLALAATDGILDPRSYTIEVLFRFDRIDGYRKIIDFDDARSDTGLYSLDGCLSFFDRAQAPRPTIEADRFVHVVLTRDVAGRVIGYVDGVASLSFSDRGGLAVIDRDDPLRFFGDDTTTGGRESSSGAVSRIRLYDEPIGAGAVATSCVELLADGCGPTTADYVASVDAVCGSATDRLRAAELELFGEPPYGDDVLSNLPNLAAWSEAVVAIADGAIAELRAIPPPRGAPRAPLNEIYALLQPAIDVLRAVPDAVAAGDTDRVEALMRRRVALTHRKDRLVMTPGRSWLALSLQSCPLALGA